MAKSTNEETRRSVTRDGRGQLTGILRIVKVGGKTVRFFDAEAWAKRAKKRTDQAEPEREGNEPRTIERIIADLIAAATSFGLAIHRNGLPDIEAQAPELNAKIADLRRELLARVKE